MSAGLSGAAARDEMMLITGDLNDARREAGCRIDHQIASRRLAERVRGASVGRAPTYAERWSDRAPVMVDFDC